MEIRIQRQNELMPRDPSVDEPVAPFIGERRFLQTVVHDKENTSNVMQATRRKTATKQNKYYESFEEFAT